MLRASYPEPLRLQILWSLAGRHLWLCTLHQLLLIIWILYIGTRVTIQSLLYVVIQFLLTLLNSPRCKSNMVFPLNPHTRSSHRMYITSASPASILWARGIASPQGIYYGGSTMMWGIYWGTFFVMPGLPLPFYMLSVSTTFLSGSYLPLELNYLQCDFFSCLLAYNLVCLIQVGRSWLNYIQQPRYVTGLGENIFYIFVTKP